MSAGRHSGPYTGPEGPVPSSERQSICSAVVGAIEWEAGGDWGYCACPGADLHHNKTARRDCRVFARETPRAGRIDPPGVYCLHTSCAGPVSEASKRIRQEIGRAKVRSASPLPRPPSGMPNSVRGVGHTARTFKFGMAEEKEGLAVGSQGGLPTARTESIRPLTRFAQVRTQAHVSQNLPSNPSEPYVQIAEVKQPKVAQPVAAPTGTADKVSNQAQPVKPADCAVDRTMVMNTGEAWRVDEKGTILKTIREKQP